MSKWWLWVNERYHQQPAHTGSYMYEVQLFQLAVIGTILWKKKKKNEWTISAPTTGPCEGRLFDLAVIGTILSRKVWKTTQPWQHKILTNLENFVMGKRLLDQNENQKVKQKIEIQVTYHHWKMTFYFSWQHKT